MHLLGPPVLQNIDDVGPHEHLPVADREVLQPDARVHLLPELQNAQALVLLVPIGCMLVGLWGDHPEPLPEIEVGNPDWEPLALHLNGLQHPSGAQLGQDIGLVGAHGAASRVRLDTADEVRLGAGELRPQRPHLRAELARHGAALHAATFHIFGYRGEQCADKIGPGACAHDLTDLVLQCVCILLEKVAGRVHYIAGVVVDPEGVGDGALRLDEEGVGFVQGAPGFFRETLTCA
mmetsp:Transcript_78045/g.137703  ORF Transcript_78045/g.137703 Transcript_78045/m.137703 type:complete len:235 (+) Transcript_78045:1192-1896(+)